MVYCGEVNKGIVEMLQAAGVNAVGLSGIDGRLLEGRRKDAIKVIQNGRRRVLRDDYTGTVERVNIDLLHAAAGERLSAGHNAPRDQHGNEAINVDGDRAAAMIAAALDAAAAS
jgi:acetylglutamate/LysW-gamma-L-alpha-aminoadipate kinase